MSISHNLLQFFPHKKIYNNHKPFDYPNVVKHEPKVQNLLSFLECTVSGDCPVPGQTCNGEGVCVDPPTTPGTPCVTLCGDVPICYDDCTVHLCSYCAPESPA